MIKKQAEPGEESIFRAVVATDEFPTCVAFSLKSDGIFRMGVGIEELQNLG